MRAMVCNTYVSPDIVRMQLGLLILKRELEVTMSRTLYGLELDHERRPPGGRR